MTHPEPGRRTLSPQQSEGIFYKYGSPRRRQAAADGLPYHLDVDLLEAGYSSDRIFPSLCLTQPAIASVEATIDWLVDEMGARFAFLPIFIPSGFGRGQAQWEPSLSEVHRACEYRARKLGSHWLRIGSLDCNVTHCRIKCYINYAGEVLPCNYLTHLSAGNIYRESLVEIHRRGKERLHFQGLQIRGPCGRCDNNDVCFGCRAKAYLYLGDEAASDPKCWMNPEARETYFRKEKGGTESPRRSN